MAIITKLTRTNNYTMRGELTTCEAEYSDYTFEGKSMCEYKHLVAILAK